MKPPFFKFLMVVSPCLDFLCIRGIFSEPSPSIIDELYFNEKEQIKYFSRSIGKNLKFGKGTISQLAHFCRPEKYPIYNTKSKEVIKYIYGTNVIEDNMIEFSNYANEIVGQIKMYVDNEFDDSDLNSFVNTYKYVLLDDFVEFAYNIIKQ